VTLPTTTKWAVEGIIAHELTHHALYNLALPLWAEEGLTQMMEERVAGQGGFALDQEMLARHRKRWLSGGVDRFLSGESFRSPLGDEQELAYNLSQLIVRRMLADHPERFFAFLRACRDVDPEEAAKSHLGMECAALVTSTLTPRST
jgi:hypothetical protein